MTIETELPAVKVKALEWEDESEGLESWRARPPVGPIYTAEDDGFSSLKYHVTAHQLVLGTFRDLDTAKAAAQADYERRIISALTLKDDPGNGGTLQDRIAELEAALEPFAIASDATTVFNDWETVEFTQSADMITLGHLRAARALIPREEGSDG